MERPGLERDCHLQDVAAEIETERLENVEITRVGVGVHGSQHVTCKTIQQTPTAPYCIVFTVENMDKNRSLLGVGGNTLVVACNPPE